MKVLLIAVFLEILFDILGLHMKKSASVESAESISNSATVESLEFDQENMLSNTTRWIAQDRAKKNKTRPIWSVYNNGEDNSTETFDTRGDTNSTPLNQLKVSRIMTTHWPMLPYG